MAKGAFAMLAPRFRPRRAAWIALATQPAGAFGNDWFVLPVELAVGALFRIRDFTVKDVFGETTQLARASPIARDRTGACSS